MDNAKINEGVVGMLEQCQTQDRWKLIHACTWWTIWEERNPTCFEDRYSSTQKNKMNCILLFHFWCNETYTADSVSILEALEFL